MDWTSTRTAREMGVAGVESGFVGFLQGWQRVYRVLPEFKVVVADLHAFLSDLRLWMDQRELGVTSKGSDLTAESAVGELRSLQDQAVDAINLLHERFEEIAEEVDEELLPAHEHFARRHLHPLVLCSPFGHRAYHKPLGYAGDYEMVNMILRSPYEGESLFAQVMNLWLLKGPPSVAHRNRIDYLVALLEREVLRCQIRGETCRVLSIGCGPAHEIQRFLASGPLADGVRFELIDMNEETLAHVASALEAVKLQFSRRTVVETRKRTVLGLLRDAARSTPGPAVGRYDFIYCAGLFDYLTDGACRQLLKACWDWLAPGGLLLATNVDTFRPFRHMLEILLDWHLTYRNQAQLRGLVPAEIPADGGIGGERCHGSEPVSRSFGGRGAGWGYECSARGSAGGVPRLRSRRHHCERPGGVCARDDPDAGGGGSGFLCLTTISSPDVFGAADLQFVADRRFSGRAAHALWPHLSPSVGYHPAVDSDILHCVHDLRYRWGRRRPITRGSTWFC